MPAFNFMPHYAPLIIDGSKRLTLRKRRKDYKPQAELGQTVKLFHGMRTSNCVHFATARISARGLIRITADRLEVCGRLDELGVRASGVTGLIERLAAYPAGPLAPGWREEFARIDGFKSWADFWTFHHAHHVEADGTALREVYGFDEVKPA